MSDKIPQKITFLQKFLEFLRSSVTHKFPFDFAELRLKANQTIQHCIGDGKEGQPLIKSDKKTVKHVKNIDRHDGVTIINSESNYVLQVMFQIPKPTFVRRVFKSLSK